MRDDVLALVQAGGQGSRMDVLTRERAKPALPFGGTHRLIDFALSSMVHSGISDVWVSLEYQVASIDEYLAAGRPWDLDRARGGFRRMVPQTGSGPATEDGFAFGNGDLLLRMARDLEARAAETLVVTSADHVFNADLRDVVAEHRSSGAAATVLTSEVTKKEAAHNVVVEARADGQVTAVAAKPSRPASGTVATEVFVYQTAPLLETLYRLRARLAGETEDDDSGLGDFGDHLLPDLVERGLVRAVPLPGYWRDLGRPEVYLQGHRDLLAGKVDVFDHPDRPVITHWPDRAAARVRPGGELTDSLLSPGCVVSGTVRGSVLGPGVVVEEGAVVEDAVLFEGVVVRRGARVTTGVLDERVEVGHDAVVGSSPTARLARDEDLVLVGRDSVVGPRTSVAAGGRLEPGSSM
ncbi:glucose-1-phosphate adenylyltransferase family protein [Nocardioides solisilvae]|uniref:glucose-1-phosphate adenylyltransferase family protein n=1 Tax=Nocardioides solisilvae TaxID=1542435 RepID=UPI00195268FE|nr:sugar phosphate nucleotidyltransferase [Nocardioides solisilvae]